MTAQLLAEREPGPAHMLVVGAGGGLELRAMAQAQPDWQFTGVDPSPAMLDIARQTTASFSDRIAFLTGTVDDAPPGPFGGATCLLTLHFLERSERLHTLKQIHRRLRPGSALVLAHHAAAGGDTVRWLARSAAFASRSVTDRARDEGTARAMAERLPLLSPAAEEELLCEAGFVEPTLFYAAFSFRGWVAIAAQ